MNLISTSYKLNKQIASTINKISKELGVDKTIVQHFVQADLERVYYDKLSIHLTKLKILENQFNDLNNRQNQLEQLVKTTISQVEITEVNIKKLEALLKEKEVILSEKKIGLNELQKKLNEINLNIGQVEKIKKTTDYKILMKIHTVEKTSSVSFKRVGWILTAFTIIAIIIAIILIKTR